MGQDGSPFKAGKIGIITGSGPEAGIDLWSKVLHENRRLMGDAFRGDSDAPDVSIVSVPQLGLSMNLPESADAVWPHLQNACERISEHVDAFAIACNTLYFFEEAIESLGLPALLVSPVDSVRAHAQQRPNDTIALLGSAPVTDFAASTSPYASLTDAFDIELPTDPARVHQLIDDIKMQGGSSLELEAEFDVILQDLDADRVLLACTELPLLRRAKADRELVDVTRLLALDLLRVSSRANR